MGDYCYGNHLTLSDESHLSDVADLPLFLGIVRRFDQQVSDKTNSNTEPTLSKDCSKNISTFIEKNHANLLSLMDHDAFKKLTAENILPIIDETAALVLLKFEQNYCDVDYRQGGSSISNLQQRCINSFIDAKLERDE